MLRKLLTALIASASGLVATAVPADVPFFFVPRSVQASGPVEFMGKGAGLTAVFSPFGVSLRSRGRVVRVEFGGVAAEARLEGLKPLGAHANFLRGPEQDWRRDVPLFSGVRYRDLYPGIDLVYSGAGPHLKSEFHLAPGADPARISIRYGDAGRVRVVESGDLVMTLNGKGLREHKPVAYQEIAGRRVPVEAQFALSADGQVGFQVGEYDASKKLVIDPVMSYSTLLGGSSGDEALGLAVDTNGFSYLTGFTESYDFPKVNPEQAGSGGGNDVFIAKLNPSGNGLVYCTYVGGLGDDRGYGISVDATGAAYVAGSTTSSNFPTRGGIQTRLSGSRNAFVVKLSPAGNSLMFGTFLGGSGSDVANGIALDFSGNAYVVGDTTSANFPATGMQKINRGGQDAFIAKLSADGSRLIYSTFLGGSGTDHGAAIAVDSSGTAYVTGSTFSFDFPLAGAYQKSPGGGQDAFVTRLSTDGNSLQFSTYLGGSGGTVMYPEVGQAIAVDSFGNAYVAGVTSSSDFPLSGAAQGALAGSSDAFVTKFGSSGTLIYSTYLGGSGIEFGNAIAVDATGAAIVAGYTYSTDLATTADALQRSIHGDCDAFLAKISSSGGSFQYVSYIGGNGSDTAMAVALDGSGGIYLAGWTLSTNFPVLNGYQSMNAGNFGAWVAKFVLGAMPVVLGVMPGSGSGASQNYSFQFSDPNGAADLTTVSGLVNATLSSASGCSVTYNRAQNALWLLTDSGVAPGGTLTPGSGSQQNSQCMLNGAASSVSMSGTVLTLNVSLTFLGGFKGAKNIYLQASCPSASTFWQAAGTWTVSASGPSIVGAAPNSGTGLSQTFTLQFSDPNGTPDLTTVSALLNTTSSTVNACSVTYSRAQNSLWLLTNAAAIPSGALTPGISGTQQNSQCTLNAAGSSVSVSGNVLTLNLALSFQTAFAGGRNIYMQAVSPWGTAGWQSAGTWSVSAGTPSAIGVTPGSGSGLTPAFAFQFSDPNGASDLTAVSASVNATSATSAAACSVTYSRAQNTLWLLTDSGAAPGGTLTPGGSGSQQNSQCTLNAASSTVSTSGNVLTLNLALGFNASFSGAKNVYLYAAGSTSSSGWQMLGTWTVPALLVGVNAISVSPASGSGLQQTFTLHYSDAAGGSDLSTMFVYFNAAFSPSTNSCFVEYSRPGNTLYLLNDTGTAWNSIRAGSSGTFGNSQCSINAASTSVSLSGTDLLLTLPVTFASSSSGSKNVYSYAAGSSANSNWQTLGTWTVPAPLAGVSAVSVSPASGAGLQQTFTVHYSDGAGAADLSTLFVYFHETFSGAANSCFVEYSRLGNTLYLLNDGATAWISALVGSSGAFGNSQCSINAASIGASVSGTDLLLTLTVTFATGYSGSKNVYAYAAGSSANSGWQTLGSWTVPAPVTGVNAVSVSPPSGAGLQQTFTLHLSNSAGAADLSTVFVYFNAAFSSAAQSCFVEYSRSGNTLYLLNDAATAWISIQVGSSGAVGNSQCSINAASTNVSLSGTGLVLTLPIAFAASFGGSKNVYAYAAGTSANSGWQTLGTWNVH